MKKIIIVLLVVLAGNVSAQQISLNSQYLFNEMLVNPGATGTKDYIPVQINFRKQWTNFSGAPTTQFASVHAKIYKKMGFGGSLYNDVTGPSRRTGLSINTAYHLQLDRKNYHTLGMGIGLSLSQHIIDVNRLNTYLPDDPAVLKGYNSQFVPDANFGLFYRYKNQGFAGLSAYNLVQMNRDLFNFDQAISNTLRRTYYFIAGYTFPLSSTFDLKTTGLVKGIETGTVQADITALAVFKKQVWLGFSYRHADAVSVLFGAQLGVFKFGYSYDYTLSDIGKYSNGSHEIFLELQLSKGGSMQSKTPWLKRNRIYSPGI